MKIETGSYTGNNLSRAISLTDPTLAIKYLRIVPLSTTSNYEPCFKDENFTGFAECRDTGGNWFTTNHIYSLDTPGQFGIGTNNDVNLNATTYAYLVIGE